MSAYGKIIPNYYDAFMEFNPLVTTPLLNLIKKYSPHPRKVLELACGTGNVLSLLPKTWELFGLDLSREMLQIAKKKLPNITFFQEDMSNFKIDHTFDLIFSTFDSIDHLNSFAQWQSMFSHVADHLNKQGIFIFDTNSLERMEVTSSYPAMTKAIGEDFVMLKILRVKKNKLYDCCFRIMKHVKGNTYHLIEEHVYETTFPEKKIVKELQKKFIVKEVLKVQMEKRFPNSLRLFFVCIKKW